MPTTPPLKLLVPAVLILLLCTPDLSLAQDQSEARSRGGIERADQDEPSGPDSEPLAVYDSKYALIIGINEYQNPDLTNLGYAVSDARAIENMLIEEYNYTPENIQLLTNLSATRDNILKSLDYYSNESISENSQLVVFYAGHGITHNGAGYLVPHDGDPISPSSSAVPMNIVASESRKMRPKHVLFLTDACYGGLSASRSAGPNEELLLDQVLQEKVRQVITAGDAGEKVFEHESLGHSAFTYTLLDVLGRGFADNDQNGLITATELYHALRYRVAERARDFNEVQTPQFSRLTGDMGEFVFFRNEAAFLEESRVKNITFENDLEKLEEAEKKPVFISANVASAQIIVNGTPINDALTEGRKTLRLPPGYHRIQLQTEKHFPETIEIPLSVDQEQAYAVFRLRPKYAVVDFEVQPEDAIVRINGQFGGVGEFRRELGQGQNRITVQKEGFETYEEAWSLVPGDTTRRSISLEPIKASLSLFASPPPIDVYLNGQWITTITTDAVAVELPYGKNAIELRRDDYQVRVLEFLTTESETINRRETLERTLEWQASRRYRTELFSNLKQSGIFSVMAVGSFIGYHEMNNRYNHLESLPDDAGQEEPSYDVYRLGRFAALGVSGLLAGAAINRLFQAASLDRDDILQQMYEENAREKGLVFDVTPTVSPLEYGMRATLTF